MTLPRPHRSLTSEVLDQVSYVDVTVDPKDLFASAQKVALTVFPAWKAEDLDLVQCKDGITNKLVKIENKAIAGEESKILIRAYGNKSEVIIDRNQELKNLMILSKNNLAPKLYARFNNGIVYGYIEGAIYSVSDMKDPVKASLVANMLPVWHNVELPGQEKKPMLWTTLTKWLAAVPDSYVNPETNTQFKANFKISKLMEDLKSLEKDLAKVSSPTVFSHNDLLYANLIYTAKTTISNGTVHGNGHASSGAANGDSKELVANAAYSKAQGDVSFIDYEYASYSYRGFDIGNHFNEMAGFECDYSLYPDKDFQMQWLRQYLVAESQARKASGAESDSAITNGAGISEETVFELYREVNKFALASHFYWGVWALVQASLSEIAFDYMGYAVLRFGEYYRRKNEVLAL